MRTRPLIHLVLALALLVNGPAMSMERMSAMADGVAAPSHCADAAMDMSDVVAGDSGAQPSQQHSGSCCSDACHCSISSAATGMMASRGTPELTVACLASSPSDVPPSLAPVRHFRPPIR